MKYLHILLVALALLLPAAANAQNAIEKAVETATGKPAETAKIADDAALKQLMETLESDTARAELLSNLKLLLQQQQGKETAALATEPQIVPLTQALGVESFTDRLMKQYQDFLARNGLKGPTVNKAGLTLGVTIVALLLLYALRRGMRRGLKATDQLIEKLEMPPLRLRLYGSVLRSAATFGIIAVLVYTYFMIWSSTKNTPFDADWFKSALKTVLNVGFVLVLAAMIWEAINAFLRMVFRRMDGENSARAKTIMPLVRNMAFLLFALVFGLILLSEIGVDITPFLAGAGVIGVAIGFGAQTMVKDFLTGFTIILEDVIRVGDVIEVASQTGTVEKITMRKIQLRDIDGTVYTIPFGGITTIKNLTKDFSFYTMNIGVSYACDTDRVCDVLRQVGEDMRAQPAYAADMMEPIEILGVDSFADSAVIIKARLKTQPLRQWAIGREFNRRMKKAFDANGIEIPFPQRVVTIRREDAAPADMA